ncbi:MAG: sugar ABC transporter permease [Cellulosilyticum sp.]|nr:sugar ABC transporter permease [Cellulosilyticum sp.]
MKSSQTLNIQSTIKENKSHKMKDRIITGLMYLEIIAVALIVLVPVLWIIGTSFDNSSSLATSSIIPKNPTLNNYKKLFNGTDFTLWYGNTLKIAIVNMVCSVIITTLTAYVFSRFKFKGKKASLLGIMVLQMFPSFMAMTAIYILFLNFGLLDNLYGLALTYIAGQIPYNVWLMKGYLGGVSMSLDEAAMLDGATRLQIFWKIIIPLAFPMITFLAVSTFMAPWMDYILPRLLISSDSKKTLAVGLYDLISSDANNQYTQFAAGAVLVAVPITILYVALQKHLIYGITAGSTKE